LSPESSVSMKAFLRSLFVLMSFSGFSQQKLSLPDLENQLQKSNLMLLAEHFNIDASQAAIIQARIWDQPYVLFDANAVNPQNHQYFDVGPSGQKALMIQQLFYLGHKKQNEVAVAKANSEIAILEYEQLLRNLKIQLAQTFYQFYFDKQRLITLNDHIEILNTLLVNYSEQSKKGNVPLKDVARLQSLVLGLRNDKTNLMTSIYDSQRQLAILTGISDEIIPNWDEASLSNMSNSVLVSRTEIESLAMTNNLQFRIASKSIDSEELNVKWQKSLSMPDVTAGMAYDQRGGAFSNQMNFTVGVPLPIWNKNKGNIKIAEAQLSQAKTQQDFVKLELKANADNAYDKWMQHLDQWRAIDDKSLANYKEVYDGMIFNFQKRNITILEFTDFMESYYQTAIQLNQLKVGLIESGLEINHITNQEIFK